MPQVFMSHSTQDDNIVRALQQALTEHQVPVWIDSRQIRGGDILLPEIKAAIEAAPAFIVVVSVNGLQSKWVGKELAHAMRQQKKRGKEHYPVIPLSLDGTKLGVLEDYFADEPAYIPIATAPGGIEAAMHDILVALRHRLPTDRPATPQPKAEPVEELVLHLSDLSFNETDGVRRATARARLVYQPATVGQREVSSAHSWRLVAPQGPIEADDLTWYLEKYYLWPASVPVIQDRARRVEQDLIKWGREIHSSAMPPANIANVIQAWARIDSHAGRRFSVLVDATVDAGSTEADIRTAKEAAIELLRLPWELLHDERSFLFQGTKPVRVRRCLPNTHDVGVAIVDPPIRILLVSARPEDDTCGYIDHRVSALPLVEAMESLPGLVQLHVLQPPTLPALRAELDRARASRQPYHVLHFDGHGVYDKRIGLGGLCFEHPDDADKLERRRHLTIYTQDHPDHGTGLASLLLDHRVPLVFLEACQTAQSDKASESVASELLQLGVASVVAMTHSVLVETARRFVATFYQSLAAGKRVGDAMLEGQRRLKDDTSRGRIFGNQQLRLEDWFVPVLYQEKHDPQLFRALQSSQTIEDARHRLSTRLGELPPEPHTGFVGRSRELLALQRLLHRPVGRPITSSTSPLYAVIRGQGGEGKTTLAVEFARWSLRSQQVARIAFVSVEIYSHLRAIVDALGRQLVGKSFTAAGELEPAIQQIERALREQQPTLLLLDNMESLLPPPYLAEQTPAALKDEAQEQLTAILVLAQRLIAISDTRLIFTSREALPPPFDAPRHRRELHQLDKADAVKLIERVINAEGHDTGPPAETSEQIEALVETVHSHARTLALLAPSIRANGVKATHESLHALMVEMEQRYPGSREQSVFASVELSLRRLSPENRERVKVFGVVHGGLQVALLCEMMNWSEADMVKFEAEIVSTGLGKKCGFGYLALNPALGPYLRKHLDKIEFATLRDKWAATMRGYLIFLDEISGQHADTRATLVRLDIGNIFFALEQTLETKPPTFTIKLVGILQHVLHSLGKHLLMRKLAGFLETANSKLDAKEIQWMIHAEGMRIEGLSQQNCSREALEAATVLLDNVRKIKLNSYPGVAADLVSAVFTKADCAAACGQAEKALLLYDEALELQATSSEGKGREAVKRAKLLSQRGNCLSDLGRYNDAAAAYENAIAIFKELGELRSYAVTKGEIGQVRAHQKQYKEALEAYNEAKDLFLNIQEPSAVANLCHQIGMAYQELGQVENAEDAYRQALVVQVQIGDIGSQAKTLGELGFLYGFVIGRLEDSSVFYRQAVARHMECGNRIGEGIQRTNLAAVLRMAGSLDEARNEAKLAVACKTEVGVNGHIWLSYSALAMIEAEAGNLDAAAEARHLASESYRAYQQEYPMSGVVFLHPHAHNLLSVARALDNCEAEIPEVCRECLNRAPEVCIVLLDEVHPVWLCKICATPYIGNSVL